jgi:hypothetical protein
VLLVRLPERAGGRVQRGLLLVRPRAMRLQPAFVAHPERRVQGLLRLGVPAAQSARLGQGEQALGDRVALVAEHRGAQDRAEDLLDGVVAPRHHLDAGHRVQFVRREVAATPRLRVAHAGDQRVVGLVRDGRDVVQDVDRQLVVADRAGQVEGLAEPAGRLVGGSVLVQGHREREQMPGPEHGGGVVGQMRHALHRVPQRVREVADLAVEDGQFPVRAGEQVRHGVLFRPGEHPVGPLAALRRAALAQQHTALQQPRPLHQFGVTEFARPALGLAGRFVERAEL